MEANVSKEDGTFLNSSETIVLFIWLTGMSILSILANTAVILTTIGTRRMRTAGSVFLLNLAFTDLMIGTIVTPLMMDSLLNGHWSHSQTVCQMVGFMTNALLTSSSLTSALISLDRYYAIIHCLRYTSWSVRKYSTVSLLLIWLISLGTSLPPLVGWEGIAYQMTRLSCFIRWECNSEYTVLMTITNSVLPLAIMLFCYCRIIAVAREHANKIKDANGKSIRGTSDCHNTNSVNATGPVAYAFMAPIKRLSMLSFPSATKSFADPYSEYFNNNAVEDGHYEPNSSTFGRQVKAITRLVSLLFVFTVAFIPFMGLNTKLSLSDSININSTDRAITTTTCLSLLPSALNPLLYAVFSRNFRLAFQRLLKTRIYPDSQSEDRKQRNSLQTYAAILRRPRSVSVISDPTHDRGQHALYSFSSYLSLREQAEVENMDGDQATVDKNRPKSGNSASTSTGQFLQVPTSLLGPEPRLGRDDGESKTSESKLPAQVTKDAKHIEKELCKDMERCRLNNPGDGWTEDPKSLSENKANIKIQLDLVEG